MDFDGGVAATPQQQVMNEQAQYNNGDIAIDDGRKMLFVSSISPSLSWCHSSIHNPTATLYSCKTVPEVKGATSPLPQRTSSRFVHTSLNQGNCKREKICASDW